MSGSKGRFAGSPKHEIERIPARKAAEIFKRCEQLLEESKPIFADFPRFGFASFLALLSDDILRLAVQPDSWGERLRARLMSDLAPALQGDPSGENQVSIEDIFYCANIIMPCLLLELGRRSRYLQIEFPSDPTNSEASFMFRTGNASPVHFIHNREIVSLARVCGPDFVALCYFGHQGSRQRIETKLEFGLQRSGSGVPSTGPKQ
ncbi:MAG TPA: hypothetical protein VJW20_04305 [Candidatus Angelobacter sp.]|nr:hypothetical protein [Candidatus Angelobacter sp.]